MTPFALEPPPPSSDEHAAQRMMGRGALFATSFGWMCLMVMPMAAISGGKQDKWLWLGAALALTIGSIVGDVLATMSLLRKGKDGKFVSIVALFFGVPGALVGLLTLLAWVGDYVR